MAQGEVQAEGWLPLQTIGCLNGRRGNQRGEGVDVMQSQGFACSA